MYRNLNYELVMNLWMFICSFVGSAYGFFVFFRKRALFQRLITCGVLSLMFASLFQVIFLLAQGYINLGFHIGVFGIIGSFMFFFSANFGQMDWLVDDKTSKFLSVRLCSFIAPVFIAIIYLWFFFITDNTEQKIVFAVITFFIMQCSYYSFKHIIIYDVENGIIKPLRIYNFLILLYCFFTMLEYVGLYMGMKPMYMISCIGIGIISICILPVLKKGVEKWAA